jgi:phospholipid/cholesterol/gamma-HCH transport system substrate-binding protein
VARRKQKLELWLGLLVIVSAVVVMWGYFWLTGQPLGERGYTVYVTLPNAEGVERGDRVKLSGVEVGVVRSVDLVASDRVLVRLWLHRDLQLPADSRALLQSVGVFGAVIVVLRPGSTTDLATDGDTLAVGRSSSLMDLAGDLGDRADAVLQQIQRLLADTAIDNVHGSLSSLQSAVRQMERLLRENGDDFAELSRSLRLTAETLRDKISGVEVEQTAADLEATAASMAETSEILRRSAESLESIAAKIDAGEGTLGLLVNEPGLYEDLQAATKNISALAEDIRLNPGRYIKVSVF